MCVDRVTFRETSRLAFGFPVLTALDCTDFGVTISSPIASICWTTGGTGWEDLPAFNGYRTQVELVFAGTISSGLSTPNSAALMIRLPATSDPDHAGTAIPPHVTSPTPTGLIPANRPSHDVVAAQRVGAQPAGYLGRGINASPYGRSAPSLSSSFLREGAGVPAGRI